MKQAIEHAIASPDGGEFVRLLVDAIRRDRRDPRDTVRQLIALLDRDADLAKRLRERVRDALGSLRLVHVLVDSGILSDRGLYSEIMERLGDKVLPRVYPPNDVRSIVATVFTRRNDHEWVSAIPSAELTDLIAHFVIDDDAQGIPHEDIAAAILALAQRIGAAGIDEEVSVKLTHVEDADSPFLALSAMAHEFLADHRMGIGSKETFERVVAGAHTCREIVEHLRDNKRTYGTSLRLTRVSRRLLQQLERFELLLHLVHPVEQRDLAQSLAPLVKALVRGEQVGHHVRPLVGQSIDLLAYQITEHTARKGEKYVAHTPRQYWRFYARRCGWGREVVSGASSFAWTPTPHGPGRSIILSPGRRLSAQRPWNGYVSVHTVGALAQSQTKELDDTSASLMQKPAVSWTGSPLDPMIGQHASSAPAHGLEIPMQPLPQQLGVCRRPSTSSVHVSRNGPQRARHVPGLPMQMAPSTQLLA